MERLKYYQDIQAQCEKNREQALERFKNQHALSARMFNLLYFLTEKYMIRYRMGIGDNRHSDVVLSTLYKGLNNMQAIMELTLSGQIGAARIVMRNVFEYLVVGKYFQLVDDEQAVKKWQDTENIRIDQTVFKKTIYPVNRNKEAFLRWWRVLCQYSHATRVSGQVGFLFEDLEQEIHVNFTFLLMLFSMLHHFMSNFLANDYFRNYVDSLPNYNEEDAPRQSLNACTQELKTLAKTIKSMLTKECKQILSYYVAAWRIAPASARSKREREPFQNAPIVGHVPEDSHLPFASSVPTNETALLEYMRSFVSLYDEPQEKLTEGYRKSVLKYLKRMQTLVTEYTFFELPDNSYFYTLEILNDRIQLLLGRRQWSSPEDTEEDEIEWTQEMVLLEIKSEYLDVEQYAAIHSVSRNTVMQWIRRVRLHGVRRIEERWLIPELQPRPEYGTYNVEYTWHSLPTHLVEKYPVLRGSAGLFICKQKGFTCYTFKVNSQQPREDFTLDDVQRIRLEMELIGRDDVEANDALVTFVPA
ncbi:hypothetical protein FACS1894196_1330 [Clostridia bacterium]|nr:hypothetical protein FACS1894196_1330 [Clostridia bacterium]